MLVSAMSGVDWWVGISGWSLLPPPLCVCCDWRAACPSAGPPACSQLAVWSQLKWYVEQEAPGVESRLRTLSPRDLLYQLPHLQRLQRRLLDCVPRGAATHDPVVLVGGGWGWGWGVGGQLRRRQRCLPAAAWSPPSSMLCTVQHSFAYSLPARRCFPLNPCPHPRPPPARPCQAALLLVVKESFKLYRAASEGVINLADAFFEMGYHDAGGWRGCGAGRRGCGWGEAAGGKLL